MIKKCQFCGKEFSGRPERKFCSKQCADRNRKGVLLAERMTKECEWCGKEFKVESRSKQRFCSTSCSALWRNSALGSNKMSEEAKQKMSKALKNRWKDAEFRKNNYIRMTENNPVHMNGVIEKAVSTRLKNGSYRNNYKYGNGKISEYEQKYFDKFTKLGFVYNFAIPTKVAKRAFPEDRFADNYKPDFVNLKSKVCVEIDGKTHESAEQKKLDAKKDKCLKFLGFTVVRFSHNDIDAGKLEEWLNKWQG